MLILLPFRWQTLTVYTVYEKNCKLDCHLNTAALLCNYKLGIVPQI